MLLPQLWVISWPMITRALQSGKIPRIGVLRHAGNEQEEAIFLDALRLGLNNLGYMEGKNIELVNRFADEHYERFDALATELVEAKVDLIFASVGDVEAQLIILQDLARYWWRLAELKRISDRTNKNVTESLTG